MLLLLLSNKEKVMAVRKEHFKVGKWFLKQEPGFEQSIAESRRRAKEHILSGLTQDVDRSVAAGNDSSYMIFTTKSQTLAPVEGEVLGFFLKCGFKFLSCLAWGSEDTTMP